MKHRKKILIMIEWFVPGYKAGGPIQSCLNMCRALRNDFDMYVFTTDKDHNELKPYIGITANEWVTHKQLGIKIYYINGQVNFFNQLRTEIRKVSPDYLYLNLFFSPRFIIYPLWLKLRKKIDATVILCPRGTLYESALSSKQYKKRPMLFLYRLSGVYKQIKFHATNQREKEAIEYFFPGSNIVVANNLPNVNQSAFKTAEKIKGVINCIFIARIVPIKNLLFVIKFLEKIDAAVKFTIVGPEENGLYWKECKSRINVLPKNITVIYAGAKNNDELTDLLLLQHLFILPTTGENFGHSIFESFLAGRPVLISNQTPWLNLPASNAGWDLPLDDPAAFINCIEKAALWNQQEFDKFANAAWRYAHEFINNPSLTKPYHQLFS
jgi:glycosyltransferase involved in cell wall biosynthesis